MEIYNTKNFADVHDPVYYYGALLCADSYAAAAAASGGGSAFGGCGTAARGCRV